MLSWAVLVIVGSAAVAAVMRGGVLRVHRYSGPADPEDLPDAGQEMLTRFEDDGREAGPWAAYGYEAVASVLAAIDLAGDPLSRSSVVDAYFDGTERDSVLGTYSITAEGETTLDAPLAAYYVDAAALVPER